MRCSNWLNGYFSLNIKEQGVNGDKRLMIKEKRKGAKMCSKMIGCVNVRSRRSSAGVVKKVGWPGATWPRRRGNTLSPPSDSERKQHMSSSPPLLRRHHHLSSISRLSTIIGRNAWKHKGLSSIWWHGILAAAHMNLPE